MYFRKSDIILYVIIAVTGIYFVSSMKKDPLAHKAGTVTVERDGHSRVFPLSGEGTFDIGTHMLVIEAGTARVTDSKCPLKICEQQGAVKDGVIACVPGRTIIIVTPRLPADDGMDVILR